MWHQSQQHSLDSDTSCTLAHHSFTFHILSVLIFSYLKICLSDLDSQLKFLQMKQECIQVGCVPAERWKYSGVCCSGGSGPGGTSLVWGGVWSQGGVWSRGVPPWSGGGVWSQGSACLVPRGGWSGTPPVNRMTHTCKNITLAKTSFRPVIKNSYPFAICSLFVVRTFVIIYHFGWRLLPWMGNNLVLFSKN